MSDLERSVRAAISVLINAERLMVLTGAGISAESGVPTFRGAGETWRNRRFDELATAKMFADDPRLVWDWYLYRRQTIAGCEPNAAHHALVERAKRTPNMTLVTQNVDGLHERAGHPDVIRLHGSIWGNRCMGCETWRDASGETVYEGLPLSPCCHVLERPAVVWFGESISRQVRMKPFRRLAKADALLVVGTSGTVQPAALFWQVAMEMSIPVINVNPEPSAVQPTIDLRGPATQILPKILI